MVKTQKFEDWRTIVNTINSVGRRRLKMFCETKKHPVKDFDRDWEIMKQVIIGNTHYVTMHYGLSRQRVNQIFRKYWKYAAMCKEELEVANDAV